MKYKKLTDEQLSVKPMDHINFLLTTLRNTFDGGIPATQIEYHAMQAIERFKQEEAAQKAETETLKRQEEFRNRNKGQYKPKKLVQVDLELDINKYKGT